MRLISRSVFYLTRIARSLEVFSRDEHNLAGARTKGIVSPDGAWQSFRKRVATRNSSGVIKRFTKMAARSPGNRAASAAERRGPFVMPRVEFQRRKATHRRLLAHTRGSLLPPLPSTPLVRLLRVLLGGSSRHSRRILTGPRGSHTKSSARRSLPEKRGAWVLSLEPRRQRTPATM